MHSLSAASLIYLGTLTISLLLVLVLTIMRIRAADVHYETEAISAEELFDHRVLGILSVFFFARYAVLAAAAVTTWKLLLFDELVAPGSAEYLVLMWIVSIVAMYLLAYFIRKFPIPESTLVRREDR